MYGAQSRYMFVHKYVGLTGSVGKVVWLLPRVRQGGLPCSFLSPVEVSLAPCSHRLLLSHTVQASLFYTRSIRRPWIELKPTTESRRPISARHARGASLWGYVGGTADRINAQKLPRAPSHVWRAITKGRGGGWPEMPLDETLVWSSWLLKCELPSRPVSRSQTVLYMQMSISQSTCP